MVKVKTSIYVDKELWRRLKRHALKKGLEISNLLEDMIRNEVIEDEIDKVLLELAGTEDYELNFEPIKPKKGLVSELVRAMRDEKADSLSRQ